MSDKALKRARSQSRCRDAFQRCLHELRALPESKLREIDVEVDDAVSTVLNTLPNVRIVRLLLRQLPGTDMRTVDNLESYALAALYAHLRCIASATDLDEMVEGAREQRAELCAAVAALPEHARAADSNPETAEDLAHDLLLRAHLARTYLHGVLPYEEKLAETLETVIESELQAEEILASLEAREPRPSREQRADERTRAAVLFLDAYEQGVRPAMLELHRRKSDLDSLALAAAYQSVAEELGPEAVQLLGPARSPFGGN